MSKCTCSYPKEKYDTESGHHPSCPVEKGYWGDRLLALSGKVMEQQEERKVITRKLYCFTCKKETEHTNITDELPVGRAGLLGGVQIYKCSVWAPLDPVQRILKQLKEERRKGRGKVGGKRCVLC
jgi:hypothetical protein